MFTELEKYLGQTGSVLSKNTLLIYSGVLERFCQEMGINSASQIVELSSSKVQDYLYRLVNEGGFATASANTHGRVLVTFFRWLNENGYPNQLSVKYLKEPKTIKDVPTPDEVRKMLSVCHGKYKLLLAMLAFGGFRRDEIVNIKVEDISGCFVIIREGKGDKQRRIPLHSDVCLLMNEYLNTRDAPDFPYLFYSRKNFGTGKREVHMLTGEAVRQIVKDAMVKAGIAPERVEKMSAHSLRRFFAVYLLQNNASIPKIQLLLGHSSPATTAIYLRSAGAEIAQDAVDNLPSLM